MYIYIICIRVGLLRVTSTSVSIHSILDKKESSKSKIEYSVENCCEKKKEKKNKKKSDRKYM